jgi:hypothetical protein
MIKENIKRIQEEKKGIEGMIKLIKTYEREIKKVLNNAYD